MNAPIRKLESSRTLLSPLARRTFPGKAVSNARKGTPAKDLAALESRLSEVAFELERDFGKHYRPRELARAAARLLQKHLPRGTPGRPKTAAVTKALSMFERRGRRWHASIFRTCIERYEKLSRGEQSYARQKLRSAVRRRLSNETNSPRS